jgi:hypothetical protein
LHCWCCWLLHCWCWLLDRSSGSRCSCSSTSCSSSASSISAKNLPGHLQHGQHSTAWSCFRQHGTAQSWSAQHGAAWASTVRHSMAHHSHGRHSRSQVVKVMPNQHTVHVLSVEMLHTLQTVALLLSASNTVAHTLLQCPSPHTR